jgi:hypothetical protein
MDRTSNGRQMSTQWIAENVYPHYDDWRGINIVATILAESAGYEWIRPMVIKDDPSAVAHLSTDRGICQFNSHWWSHVPDHVAFDPEAAINQMCLSVGTDGWAINLDWWNAYKSGAYEAYVGMARVAMNAVRDHHGQPVI